MSSVAVNPPKTPVTKGSSGMATATLPNMCKMPPPPPPFCPTPLPNIGMSGKNPQKYSTTVKIEGNPVAIQGSTFDSTGDIASKGTGGGVVSNNAEGPTAFVAPGSLDVKIEGKNVQFLGDQMLNNCGPAGSPANSATMGGVLQVPTVVFAGDLDALADECNKKTNAANDKCPGGPSGKECTALGTAKHKCCENAIKEYNKNNKDSKFESEVPFSAAPGPNGSTVYTQMNAAADASARSAAATVYEAAKSTAVAAGKTGKALAQALKGVWSKAYFGSGGAAFKADVLVKGADGKWAEAHDFKFNCGDEGTMSSAQVKKYRSATGLKPKIIHKDGRKC